MNTVKLPVTRSYQVNTIYPCLQGEGCLTGTPMMLIRLQYCPVGCPFCDTKETWHLDNDFMQPTLETALGTNKFFADVNAHQIVSYLSSLNMPQIEWVLLTGGEPAAQPLKELFYVLKNAGYKIALETSGVANGCINVPFDWLCVSPKIGMPGGYELRADVLAAADEIKYVIGKQRDIDTLKGILANNELKKDVVICVQPMSQSAPATQICIKAAMDNGWRLSIQTHKYLKLP